MSQTAASYPTAMGALGPWATANGVTLDEARRRFAQYVVLCAIVSVAKLRRHLVSNGPEPRASTPEGTAHADPHRSGGKPTAPATGRPTCAARPGDA